MPPGRPEDAQARGAGPALGRRLCRGRHRRLPGEHRQAGHDRDRAAGVRRGARGHPHVRPAQALRARRRRGPRFAPVQAPGHGHHGHDGPRDPGGRGRPPGPRLHAHDPRGRRRRHLPCPVRDDAVHGAARGRHRGHQRRRLAPAAEPVLGGQGGLGLRAGGRRAPAVQPEPRDPQRAPDGRPRPADPSSEGPAYSAGQMAVLAEFGPPNGTKETVRP